MDLQLTATGIAAGVVAQDLAKRILGPSADQLGGDLAKSYQAARANISRVVRVAAAKLGDSVNEPGGIHPRVGRRTFREAQDVDSPFAAEYFGGLLASSRNSQSNDDSAIPFLKTIEGLSTQQIRFHFVTHYLFAKLLKKLPLEMQTDYWKEVGLKLDIETLELFFGSRSHMQWDLTTEVQQMVDVGIFGERFTFVSDDAVTGCNDRRIKSNGLYIGFSRLGLQLFLRALGQRGCDPNVLAILDVDFSVSSEVRPKIDETTMPKVFRLPLSSTPNSWDERLEDIRFEAESNLDDTNSTVEALKDELNEIREALVENIPSGEE